MDEEENPRTGQRQSGNASKNRINGIIQYIERKRHQYKTDSYHQTTIDRMSIRSLILTFFILVVTGANVYVAYKQEVISGRQLHAMEVDERAWISLPKITLTPNPPDPGKVGFTYTFKNIGKTPTAGLYIGVDLVSGNVRGPEQPDFCAKGRNLARFNSPAFVTPTIIPGDEFIINGADVRTRADAPQGVGTETAVRRWIEKEEIKATARPNLMGCVVYKTRFDDDFHYLEFTAALIVKPRKAASAGNGKSDLASDVDISVDQVYTRNAT